MIKTLAIAVALLGAACGKKAADDSTKRGSAAAGSTTTQPPAKAASTDARLAFALGCDVGYVEVAQLTNQPDRAGATLTKAQTMAQALGITPPATLPGKGDHLNQTIYEELGAKKSSQVAHSFGLGFALIHTWVGAKMGADVTAAVGELENWATESEVPDALWRAPYDKLKAKPTADALDAFEKLFETYYR